MSVVRLPRIGAFPRLFLSLVLLAAAATAADAQTCTLTVNAPPSACTNTPVTASVQPPSGGGSWASVSWSITGGFFRTESGPSTTATTESVSFSPDAVSTVTLTTRATDGSGCTTPEVVTTLPVSDTPVLVINGPDGVCPYSSDTHYASIAPPDAGSWSDVVWSISGGNFVVNGQEVSTTTGELVEFRSYVLRTTLYASAQHSSGCPVSEASFVVPWRDMAVPVIDVPAQVCPYATATAWMRPPDGGSWQNVNWSITNGFFRDQYGNQVTSLSGPSTMVEFFGNGMGPVTIEGRGTDNHGCPSATTMVEVPIRAIPAPAIDVPPQICPYTIGTAWMPPPAEGGWATVNWSIVNGFFRDAYGNQLTSLSGSVTMVEFFGNGAGPVTITGVAQDTSGCWSPERTVEVPLRTVAPPVLQAPPQVCPYTIASVWAPPPAEGTWETVSWSITNGFLRDQYGSSVTSLSGPSTMVEFYGTGEGPVTITAAGRDSFGCQSLQTSVEVPLRTVAPPVLQAPPQVCPYTIASVWAPPPAEGTWETVSWSITNGFLRDQYGSSTTSLSGPSTMVEFYGTGEGPVTITAAGRDSFGCQSLQTDIQVPLRTVAPPALQAPPQVCPYTIASVWAPPPAEGTWETMSWSITNGFLRDQYGSSVTSLSGPSTMVEFYGTGEGPVTITAAGRDSFGCQSLQTSVTIALSTPPAMVITAPAEICSNAPATASVAPPAQGSWQNVSWSITNGWIRTADGSLVTLVSGPATSIEFIADGAGTVTLSARGSDSSGCQSAESSAQVPLRPAGGVTIQTDAGPTCMNTPKSAWIDGTWTNIDWSIEGGTITSSTSTATITFQVTAPSATLTVTARDAGGCPVMGTYATNAEDSQAPQLAVSTATLCIYTEATATVTNGPAYPVTWSISGGEIIGSATGHTVTFFANSTAPVTLTATPGNGCAAPASITVPVHPTSEPSITSSHPMPFCPGTAVTLTASEGASWLWSTGATTRSIVITTGGIYRVGITDANGCVRNWTFNADQVPTPEVSILANGPTQFCEGGSVVLTPDVDQPGATYLWSNGATTRSITATEAGQYTVTMTFTSGCSRTSPPVTVVVDPAPEAVITAPNNAICGTSGLRLDATAGADAYLWSTGETTSSIVVTQPGDYTVTVTKNGCSKTSAPFTVTPGTHPSAMPDPTDVWVLSCPNGTATASITNPELFARIEWTIEDGVIVGPDDGASVTFRNNTANTMLRVRGFSATGCSTENQVYVLVDPPSSDFSTPARVCAGEYASSGVWSPANQTTYEWAVENATIMSYGEGNRQVIYIPNGNGPVTVTCTANRAGCVTTTTKVVPVDVLAQPVVTGPAPRVCTTSGHTATASDGGEGTTYAWGITGGTITSATNGRTITFDVDPNAPYTRVTVGVSKGSCYKTASADTIYDVPQATVTASSTWLCPGGSATLTSSPAASYLWSTGATTQSIAVSQPGNYTVTTTSQGGCSTTSAPATISAETASAPVIDLSPDAVCWSQTDVTAIVTNSSQYTSISWTTSATPITAPSGPTFAVRRAAGPTVYWVEATGTTANGCQLTTRVEIPVDPIPDTTITSSAASFCDGGTYTVSVPDAGPGATYQWRVSHGTIVSGANSPAMTIQAAYNGYSLVAYCDITEPRGCMVTASTEIPVSSNPTVDIVADTTSCVGKTNTASVSRIEGATYQWTVTNGELITPGNDYAIYFRGTTAGTVTLQATVTVNGCSTTDTHTVTIEQYTSTITANGPTTFCQNGSVTLTADGPAGATYQWSDGRTGQSIVVTSSGNYDVTMWLNGCSVQSNSIQVTVNQPPPIPEVTASGPLTFCEGGSVTLTAPDGYTYLWSNGATTRSITVGETNSYSVTVYNESGCGTSSWPVSVTVHDAPGTIETWTYGPTTFCEGGSVTIVASGTYGYNFRWSNGATTQSITVTQSGGYTVTVTNDAGCSNTSAPVNVTVLPTPPKPVVTASGPTTFCQGGSVTLTAPDGYSYAWSTGETTQAITVQWGGNYSVTVTNAEGCSATSDPVYVLVYGQPLFNWTYYGEVCAGVESSREISAPTDAQSYAWSITNGTITRTENNRVWFIATANPVTLTATVTNSNGCSYTSSQTLPVNNAATPTITASGATTFCNGNSVTLTSSPASSYLWSTGATTPSITVSQSGSYSVTITDANGCSATSAPTVVTVNDNPVATITAEGPTTFCNGSSVTLTASPGASYLWSTGATSPSITVADSGSYTVTVTNESGCSTTSAPATVTVHPLPATPVVTEDGPLTFCQGGTVRLTAPDGFTYSWSNGSTARWIDVNQSGTFAVTVTDGNGCSATSAPKTVTVNQLPEVPVIAVTGSTALCPNETVTLTAPEASSWTWSNGATTQSITVGSAGQYSVTVTNASGCTRSSAPVTVTQNPATVITSHPASITMPRNVTRTLSVTAAGTATLQYQWYRGYSGDTTQPVTTNGTSSTLTVGPFPKKGTHRYWVRVTSSTCPNSTANSTTATVTVN